MKSRITDYSLDTHKHLLAAWAASTAASQSKYFRFSVEGGTEILLLGATGNIIHKNIPEEFIHHINKVKEIKNQKEFDDWHQGTIQNMRTGKDLGKVLQAINNKKKEKNSTNLLQPINMTYGIAAKILNVYLKVFYLGDFDSNEKKFADFIHPPIDRLLLLELVKREGNWFKFDREPFVNMSKADSMIPNWTLINEEEYKAIIKLILEYINANDLEGLWRIEYAWRGHQ